MKQTMNSKLLLGLALVLSGGLLAHAHGVRSWSDAELMKAADLVVVATPLVAKDLDETNSLGWSQSESFRPRFRGVETAFKVYDVLKGMPANDRIVLHHYRNEIEWGSPANGPGFVTFTQGSTNKLVLYLVKDGADRYAPIAGQVDSYLSIRPLPTDPTDRFFLFHMPILPPIAEADPSIRNPVSARVPTRLKVERTDDTLSVEIDTNSYVSTNLMVGTNMVTGSDSWLYVYPIGGSRPSQAQVETVGGTDCLLAGIWHKTDRNGIPVVGKKYVVEADFIIFETDIPSQHMWMPWGSKNYQVLWRRTLKQIVE
jgi:hypothetical protein